MVSLKLKLKVDILRQLTTSTNQPVDDLSMSSSKSKTRILSSVKNSGRRGENTARDLESLPGYKREVNSLVVEEKDELETFLKSISYSHLTKIFSILNEKKLYSHLKSKHGLEIIRNVYKGMLSTKTDYLYSEENEYSSLEDTLIINDECELYLFLRDYLNMSELDAMDLFDIFKFNEFFAITEKNFILLIFLLAGYESGQLEDFILSFYEELFSSLSGNESLISLSRLKEVGRILGFDELVLSKVSSECSLDFDTLIDLPKFKQFYLGLGKIYDEQFKSERLLPTHQQGSSASRRTQEKAKTTGCMNKACNIL